MPDALTVQAADVASRGTLPSLPPLKVSDEKTQNQRHKEQNN